MAETESRVETIEEVRMRAAENLDHYHDETKSWRDKKVIKKDINPGDWVLVRHPDKQGKLQPQWYGPFLVSSKAGTAAFRLKNQDGEETTHTWNCDNLKRFYP